MPDQKEILPAGVTLRDFEDFDTARKEIFDGVREEMLAAFPIRYGGLRMELQDADYEDPETFDTDKQKHTLLSDGFLGRRLRGTLVLRDEKTGAEISSKKLTLLKVPYLTGRGTFIRGGSEYTTANQLRLLPGSYTRRQQNGELETQFNVRPGTGTNFRVSLEPDTSQYRLRVKQSNLHLYSLLHDLGVPDHQLEKSWGPEILEMNRKKYDAKVFDKAFERLFPAWKPIEDGSREGRVKLLRQALDDAQIHERVARRNLPNMFDLTKSAAWLDEHEKLSRMVKVIDFNPKTDLSTPVADDDEAADWRAWLSDYNAGMRNPEDDARIDEWKRLRIRAEDLVKERPTAKVAAAMAAWCIDAFDFLDQEKSASLRADIADLESEAAREDAFLKLASIDKRDLQLLALFLNAKHQAGIDTAADYTALQDAIINFVSGDPSINVDVLVAGLDAMHKGASEDTEITDYDPQLPMPDFLIKDAGFGGKGCLTVRIPESTAGRYHEWLKTNVPESALADQGYEHELHVTIAYGFDADVTVDEIRDALHEWGGVTVGFKLGSMSRFYKRGEYDVLKVDAEGRDLRELNTFLREKFGARLKTNFPTYNPHITLAYLRPGNLKALNGHDAFNGAVFRESTLVYSEPGSVKKHFIDLHANREQHA